MIIVLLMLFGFTCNIIDSTITKTTTEVLQAPQLCVICTNTTHYSDEEEEDMISMVV